MNSSHLLLWFQDGQPRACKFAELPSALSYHGDIFHAETRYFGDVDYLRDEHSRLIGFAYYSTGEWVEAIRQKLLSQSPNVKLDDGALVIMFETRSYEIQSVAAMGTEVYCAASGQVILAIPNWDFGDLAFDLATADIPKAGGVPNLDNKRNEIAPGKRP